MRNATLPIGVSSGFRGGRRLTVVTAAGFRLQEARATLHDVTVRSFGIRKSWDRVEQDITNLKL